MKFFQFFVLCMIYGLLVMGCASKSYVVELGDNASGTIEAGWMQNEILSGTLHGPLKYCSLPKDATINPCPNEIKAKPTEN